MSGSRPYVADSDESDDENLLRRTGLALHSGFRVPPPKPVPRPTSTVASNSPTTPLTADSPLPPLPPVVVPKRTASRASDSPLPGKPSPDSPASDTDKMSYASSSGSANGDNSNSNVNHSMPPPVARGMSPPAKSYGSMGTMPKSPAATHPKDLVAPSPLDCQPHPMFHSAMGDVDIIVERTLFKVHSSVLMMNSRRLAELISALKPKLPDGSVDVLEPMTAPLFLPDETQARFSTLLRWMYPGSSPTKGKSSAEQAQINNHNCLDLMALSVKYDSPKLTRECEEFLRKVEPPSVINSTNLEGCFVKATEYRKRGFVRLLDMCFQFLHDKVSDFSYSGDFVTMLLLAEKYRLPTVRYQAWARVVSSLPAIQHTSSFLRLPESTQHTMRNLRYSIMCAFETVGRLVLQLYPVDCGCRARALSDWMDKVEWAWMDGWKWDNEGVMRLSFAVPSLGTCEEHEEEALSRQVEIQQCWVGEQEIYDGFEVQLDVIEREPGESLHGSLESLGVRDREDSISDQS